MNALKAPCVSAWREARTAHLTAHDGDGLGHDVAPRVAVHPEADHLLDPEEAVVVHLPDEAEELEDRLAVQLAAAAQVHLVPRHALHAEGVLDELTLPRADRQEVDVADAEARLLRDLAHGALLVRLDGVVSPGVEIDELVHGLRDVHVPDVVQRVHGPVRHPRGHARACQVPAAADEVDLMHAKLAAGADVLHRESAVSHDRHVQALELVVVDLVEHGVADVAAEDILALVGLLPGQREVAGEHADARGFELFLGRLLVSRLCRHKLPVLQPPLKHLLRYQVVPDHLQSLRPREGAVVGDDGHLLDIRVETDVRHDALFLHRLLEHVEERVARGPGGCEESGDGVVLTVGKVVGTVLRLQLGRGVGLVHPGGAADPAHPVEDDEVQLLPLVEEHCHTQAEVACADDDLGVLVLLRQPRERGDALHNHLPIHLLVRVQLPEHGTAPVHELHVGRVDGELPCQHLRDLQDGRAGHARPDLLLAG
mmetsp:Transcript_66049/g.204437  ORF Transcript_66049/g.204437 Transcript_66049/m.204437 type:complete len:483 (+) Transcript_66049:552-2000(+)